MTEIIIKNGLNFNFEFKNVYLTFWTRYSLSLTLCTLALGDKDAYCDNVRRAKRANTARVEIAQCAYIARATMSFLSTGIRNEIS